MIQLVVTPIEDQVVECLPLVRLVAPDIGLDQWRSYVARVRSRGGGVLGVFAYGALQGIAAYRPDDDLHEGRTLRVNPLVTLELSHAAPARTALCEALERVAREAGCASLTVTILDRGYADPRSVKLPGWSSLGLDLESVTFSKRLRPPAPAATLRTPVFPAAAR